MIELKEKLQIALWLFLHALYKDKLLCLFTIIRHFIQYSFFPHLTPRDVMIALKGDIFFFREFTGEISMYKQIYINRIYDSHPDFRADGNTNAIVFDIGANIGIYTVRTAKTYANCMVYSFEPNPDVYARLKKNISLNKLNNVKPFPLGFADRKTTAYLDAEQSTVLGRISYEKGQTEVDLETLDLFVAKEPVHRIDILKIDVEGFELSVLKGAEHVLQRVKRIVMECDKALEQQVCTYLEGKGFRLLMKIPQYNILYFHHRN